MPERISLQEMIDILAKDYQREIRLEKDPMELAAISTIMRFVSEYAVMKKIKLALPKADSPKRKLLAKV